MNTHVKPPAEPQEALYRRTDIAPELFFQALGRVRREARDEIERLITWLDSTIDVDEDSAVDDEGCDDSELESSLGSFDRLSNQIKAWQPLPQGQGDDAEVDTCDREPSLGSVERSPSSAGWRDGHNPTGDQTAWAGGTSDDREQEHDGAEPAEDDEPSLCGITADVRMTGDDRDLEGDDSDREPSLGWTIDGAPGNWDDRELQNYVGPRPGKMLAARQRFAGRICNVRPIPGAEWRVS